MYNLKYFTEYRVIMKSLNQTLSAINVIVNDLNDNVTETLTYRFIVTDRR